MMMKTLVSTRTITSSTMTSSEGRDDDDEGRVSMRGHQTLPPVEEWPHRPLMVCLNSAACPSLQVPDYGLSPCPLGVPFKISSDLFEGSCLLRVSGLQGDNPDPRDQNYFDGRKRLFQSVVQGRFKETVPALDVMTGQEFARPAKNIPFQSILKIITSVASKVFPGGELVAHSDQPYFKLPMLCSCSVVRGDEPGEEPDISCHNIQEDCSVFGGVFAEENVSVSQRKKIFSDPPKCRDFLFDTEKIYTFEKYYDCIDLHSYTLDFGYIKVGLGDKLDGQPIQQMGKLRDGRYLWSFQLWNEKFLLKDTLCSDRVA